MNLQKFHVYVIKLAHSSRALATGLKIWNVSQDLHLLAQMCFFKIYFRISDYWTEFACYLSWLNQLLDRNIWNAPDAWVNALVFLTLPSFQYHNPLYTADVTIHKRIDTPDGLQTPLDSPNDVGAALGSSWQSPVPLVCNLLADQPVWGIANHAIVRNSSSSLG